MKIIISSLLLLSVAGCGQTASAPGAEDQLTYADCNRLPARESEYCKWGLKDQKRQAADAATRGAGKL